MDDQPDDHRLLSIEEARAETQLDNDMIAHYLRSGLCYRRGKDGEPEIFAMDLDRFPERFTEESPGRADYDEALAALPPAAFEHWEDGLPFFYRTVHSSGVSCPICLGTTRCSWSADKRLIHCARFESNIRSTAGGYFHPYPGSGPSTDAELVPAGVTPDSLQPSWDEEQYAALRRYKLIPRCVDFCWKAGDWTVQTASGKVEFTPRACASRLCPTCGPSWGQALLIYFWMVWAKLSVVWCATEVPLDNRGCVRDLLRDRVQGRAEKLKAQYLLVRRGFSATVFADRPLPGKSEPESWIPLTPIQALSTLKHSTRLPEPELKVTASKHGNWALPTSPRVSGLKRTKNESAEEEPTPDLPSGPGDLGEPAGDDESLPLDRDGADGQAEGAKGHDAAPAPPSTPNSQQSSIKGERRHLGRRSKIAGDKQLEKTWDELAPGARRKYYDLSSPPPNVPGPTFAESVENNMRKRPPIKYAPSDDDELS